MGNYADKLLDPRWQKCRLKILERDLFMCQWCLSSTKTLHVHHLHYTPNTEPWNEDPLNLVTICHECHLIEHSKLTLLERNLVWFIRSEPLVYGLYTRQQSLNNLILSFTNGQRSGNALVLE